MRSPCIASLIVGVSVSVAAAGVPLPPQPVGQSLITVSYTTRSTGLVSFSGSRDYSGQLPSDATNLGDAPNIRAFNAVNAFGRRTIVPGATAADESVMAHAFFKIDNTGDYFPDIVDGGEITITVQGVDFASSAAFDPSTVMLHVKWLPDQVDQLPMPYIQVDDHYTQTDPYRDFQAFLNAGVFSDFPVANYVLEDIQVDIAPGGNDSFDLSITFPYEQLKNLEDSGQAVPGGLPAPQGFLEPFHFHIEYVVSASGAVPAASHLGLGLLTSVLIVAGGVVIRRRRPGSRGRI